MKSHSQLAAKSIIVVDVAAMIWTLDWPSRGKAKVHDKSYESHSRILTEKSRCIYYDSH